jgi:glycosyltransferase involved in cell wall biosynthesis
MPASRQAAATASSADGAVTTPARVLWLIKGLGPGGAERLLVDAARSIERDRFDVSAAYLLAEKDQLVGELRDAGVRSTCLGARGDLDPRWVAGLRRLVHDRGIDLVHAHSPVAAVGARLGVGGRTAIVTTEHNTWDRYRPATRRANAATFARQQAVIAVSNEVARSIGHRIRSRPGPSVEVIPNGIDAEALRTAALPREAARRELGLPLEVPVVGTIGGVTAKKGHVDLVRAAARLVRSLPDARVAIVGLEIDAGPVRHAIAAAGLQGRVLLAGYRPEAARLLRAFDVFTLASRYEGMPLSLLEAMVLGLPVVATSVGGIPEVVTSGRDGLLVAPGDEVALAAAWEELVADPARGASLGAAAARTAERFSLGETVRRTQDVYDAALADRRRR